MTHAAYVFAGYAITTAVLAAYAGWIISRRRALLRQLRQRREAEPGVGVPGTVPPPSDGAGAGPGPRQP